MKRHPICMTTSACMHCSPASRSNIGLLSAALVQADGALAHEERVAAVRRHMQEDIMNKLQQDRSSGAVERVKADAEAKARCDVYTKCLRF